MHSTFFRWFPTLAVVGRRTDTHDLALAEVAGGEMIDVGEAEGHGARSLPHLFDRDAAQPEPLKRELEQRPQRANAIGARLGF